MRVLFVAGLAVALAPRLLEYAAHQWDTLFFPWQLDFDEGVNLNASWLLAHGTNIYKPYTPDHFVSALYPPVSYALNAAALKLWGLNLWSGRLLALLGSIGTGACLWAWVQIETRRPAAGALAALLWFSLGPVYVWSSFYKQDMPALGLGVGGCALAALSLRREGSRGTNLLYWSIVPLALSFWMKQSSLAPIGAVGIAVLIYRRQVLLRWGVAAVAAIVVPFAAMTLLTKGGFWEHMLAFNAFGRSVARLTNRADALWSFQAPLVIAGIVFLLAWALTLKRGTPSLGAIFLLISIPATVLGLLHPTGNYNHLLNILAPLCLALGTIFGTSASEGVPWERILPVSAAILAVAQVGVQWQKPSWTWYTPLGMPLSERAARMRGISEVIAKTPGDVFSEDAWLLLKNNKRVLYDDSAAMSALGDAGVWDESTFIRDLNRHKFPLLILQYDLTNETYNPRWSNRALDAARANYAILFRDVLFAHAPRPPSATPERQTGCRLGDGPILEGYSFRASTANHSDTLPLSLYWRKGSGSGEDTKFFVRLIDAAGNSAWGADLPPGQAAGRPQALWNAKETVRDDLSVPVADNLASGQYRLIFGAYRAVSAGTQPISINCRETVPTQPDGTLILQKIEVQERWGR